MVPKMLWDDESLFDSNSVIYFWMKHHEYFIEDGCIKPVSHDKYDLYLPLRYPELSTDFASLYHHGKSEASEDEILRFCRKYGIFGRKSWALKIAVHNVEKSFEDTLEWIYLHARQLWLCYELNSLINQIKYEVDNNEAYSNNPSYQPKEELAKILSEWCSVKGKKRLFNFKNTVVNINIVDRDYLLNVGNDDIIAAMEIISQIINENLTYISREVYYNSEEDLPQFKNVFSCQSLMEYIYFQAANNIVAANMARCIECGKFFQQTKKGQKFCPSNEYYNGRQQESRCATRYRQRKYRESKKK